MSIKKTGNFRASKRGMSTLAVPSRQGLLKINDVRISDKVGEWQEYTEFGASIQGSSSMVFTDSGNSYMEYMQIGPIVFVQGIVSGTLSGTASNTVTVGVPIQPEQVRVFDNPWTTGFAEHAGGTDIAGDVFVDRATDDTWAFNRGPTNAANWGLGTMQVRFQGFYQCEPSLALDVVTTSQVEEIINSSFFDLQQNVASNGLSGLVEYYNEQVITLAGSGDFTVGTAKVVRINDTVSIQMTTANWQNSSSSQPRTAAGLLPDWARPNDDLTIVNGYSGSAIIAFFIGSNGTLGYDARNYSGSLTSNSSMSVARTATWVVEP